MPRIWSPRLRPKSILIALVRTGGLTVSDENNHGASRRQFIGWAGAVGGAALFSTLGPAGSDPALLDALADRIDPDFSQVGGGFTLTLRRPEDQLLLTLISYNCIANFANDPPTLEKAVSDFASYLTVTFGHLDTQNSNLDNRAPMHVAEQAFTLTGNDELPSQPDAPTPPGTTSTVNAPPVGSRMAGSTMLGFQIPDNLLGPLGDTPLTLTTHDLLNFVNLTLHVVPNAVPPFTTMLSAPAGIGTPRPPDDLLETAIELPYNLIISPPARYLNSEAIDPALKTVFVNAFDPVKGKGSGWTELWHTRLAATIRVGGIDQLQRIVIDEVDRDLRTIRAVWCTDQHFQTDLDANTTSPPTDNDPNFKQTALLYGDRYDIVRLSSDFTPDAQGGPYGRTPDISTPTLLNKNRRRPQTPFIPSPATVDRLMLTSLGAWLDSDAHWDLPFESGKYNSSLLQWKQRTVQARDSFVRIVRKGYLFPWGHKASVVTVTERQFKQVNSTDGVGAYLRQRTFIIVGEPTKNYDRNGSIQHDGRNIPFTDVEILTRITPDLDQPAHYVSATLLGNGNDRLMFQPTLGGAAHPFKFHMRATDWAGDSIDFHSPVLFVDETVSYTDTAHTTDIMTAAITKWNGAPAEIDLRGQRVSMAPPKDPTVTGDTQLVLASYKLGTDPPAAGITFQHLIDTSQPAFFPALASATIKHPEAETVSGNDVPGSTMKYHDHYLTNNPPFANNPGGVFLETTGTAHEIKFDSDKGGGSMTPNLSITGFSRDTGPVSGDVATFRDGTFDPAEIFQGVDAKLLGGIPLKAILQSIDFTQTPAAVDDPSVLRLTSVQKNKSQVQPTTQVITTLDWKPWTTAGGPTVLGETIEIFVPLDTEDDNGVQVAKNSTDLHAVIVTDLDKPANSSSNIIGEIRDFELHLFGSDEDVSYFINIPFDRLHFHARSGKKTDVQVDIADGGVGFKGALEFVQDLADALSFAGSGLTVDTSGDAIKANLTLAIPSLSVGVFGLENLAFIAGVAIPYNGDPVRFDFSFCTRDNPFQLEIMIFTGGGFVGLGVGADGVELLEFSFDFGLGFSIDIGIASGQISFTGGVYYELEKNDHGGENIDLTAWVKAGGGISALGLISISVELYLALEYQVTDGQSSLAGDAELSISVHIIFFGFDVGFSIHEEFAGSSSLASQAGTVPGARRALASSPQAGPLDDEATNLLTSMSAQDWERYCTSFALIAG